MISGVLFTLGVSTIAMLGESTLDYSIGQHIYQPVFARLAFQIPDADQSAADREAARASVPSYYERSDTRLTFERIRSDLVRVYEAAVNADTFAVYEEAVKQLGVPAEVAAYERLHALADDDGRGRVRKAVDELPLEQEYVVRDLLRSLRSPRTPASVTDFVRLELPVDDGVVNVLEIPHADLIRQLNTRALEGSAIGLARRFSIREMAGTVQAVVLRVFSDQPTILFNRERTAQAMQEAANATPEAVTAYAQGETLVKPGVVGSEEYDLLRREHAAYLDFLLLGTSDAVRARNQELRRRFGMVGMMTLLSMGLLTYVGRYHRRIFEVRTRTLAFMLLVLGTLLAVRLIDMRVPNIPELVLAPALKSIEQQSEKTESRDGPSMVSP
ncbi:MAG: hypothetical protein IH989_03880 [Planctomycetes bacterium]|nr:hypothetical protein [Planctomycetota bacterium]